MGHLLNEWVTSGKAPSDEDVAAWVDAFQKIVLVDPRSCTILLRSLYRLAPMDWSDRCDDIREKLQNFIDVKIQSGELTVAL